MAWARPISPPSTVTTELLDMFCALNGATRVPPRASNRHRAATTTDFPASELVPATSRAPLTSLWRAVPRKRAAPPAESHGFPPRNAILCLLAAGASWQREDFDAGVGDQQGVLELGGPLAVLGDHRPAVVPDLVVQAAEVDHRFDGERHARLHDGRHGGLVVVQDDQAIVKRGADAVTGEVANDVVAEPIRI